MRVLAVDDDDMNRKVCRAMLEMAGVEVVEASSGIEALTHIEEEVCFDAVLMDMRMPGMDGLSTAKAIRARQDHKQAVPIIIVSGSAHSNLESSHREMGIDAMLIKPVDMKSLYGALNLPSH
jgi:CheY-like chemotaxis protein